MNDCPFCGPPVDDEPVVRRDSFSGFSVTCPYCEATGPIEITEEKAIAAWNKRARPAVEPLNPDVADAMTRLLIQAEKPGGLSVSDVTLKVKRLNEGGKVPTRANPDDAGLDLFAPCSVHVPMGVTTVVPLGIAIDIPPGWFARICDRSSVAKRGITVLGGCMDAGYTGEWKVILMNSGGGQTFKPGDAIAQFTLHRRWNAELVDADELTASQRGERGFGSSDREPDR
jgi:dUTP pyrophosphatase